MFQLGYTTNIWHNVLLKGAEKVSDLLTITFLGFNPDDNVQCPYFEKCPTRDKYTIGCRDYFGNWHDGNCGFYREFYSKQLKRIRLGNNLR